MFDVCYDAVPDHLHSLSDEWVDPELLCSPLLFFFFLLLHYCHSGNFQKQGESSHVTSNLCLFPIGQPAPKKKKNQNTCKTQQNCRSKIEATPQKANGKWINCKPHRCEPSLELFKSTVCNAVHCKCPFFCAFACTVMPNRLKIHGNVLRWILKKHVLKNGLKQTDSCKPVLSLYDVGLYIFSCTSCHQAMY